MGRIQLCAVSGALLGFVLLAGCGGSGVSENGEPINGSNPNYGFDSHDLNCPSASLSIVKESGADFPANTDVTFKNISTGKSYDAGAGVSTNSGLITGMPAGAPAGDYGVFVTQPGGTPVEAGTISYTLTNCSN